MPFPLDHLRQKLEPGTVLAWHNHMEPYAAIVLEGAYFEAGDGGRRQATAGSLVVHPPFSGHTDVIGSRGAVVFNLPLSLSESLALSSGNADVWEAFRDHETRWPDLGPILRNAIVPAPAGNDLPDHLAAVLEQPSAPAIGVWAEAQAISARSATRQFVRAYGITPAHYRWRARTRAAWREVVASKRALAAIAYKWGFSDQAHMTRSVRQLTGRPPNWWRQRRCVSD